MKKILFLSLFVFLFGNVFSQIIEFNFNTDPYINPSLVENGLTGSDLQISANTIATNIITGTYFLNEPYIESSTNWNAATQADAKNFFFTISAQTGFQFSITQITFDAYSTSAGPSAYGVTIDNDNILEINAENSILQNIEANTLNHNNLNTATVKIQGWLNNSRVSAGSGTFRLDNVKVYGTVSPIEIKADRMQFQTIPNFVLINENFNITLKATDTNGNIDTDFNESVSLALLSGDGNLNSAKGLTTTFGNGIAEFTELTYDKNQAFSLKFTTSNLTQNTLQSNTIQTIEALSSEDFADNNFTTNPTWFGNTEYFTINQNLQLQSNGPQASSKFSIASFSPRAQETEWRFLVDLGFNPSSTNFARIYLISDQEDLTQNLNGYFIQLGQSNEDYIKLFKQQGSTMTELASGTTAFPAEILSKIKVTRSNLGDWKIYSATAESESYYFEVQAVDNNSTTSTHFGFYCNYATTSRFNLFRFDDIYVGEIIPDTEKPYIQEIQVISKNKLQIKVSEYLNNAQVITLTNYKLNSNVNPISVSYSPESNLKLILNFENAFAEGFTNLLSIENLSDLAGNVMEFWSSEFVYTPIKFVEIGVNSSKIVTLYFTQAIKDSYASTLTNFTLTGNKFPSATSLSEDKKSIELTFVEAFAENTNYSLQLANVQTQGGDEVAIPTIGFVYHKPVANDLVFNEIMADPDPSVQLPAKEYIEIYNRSDFTITLKNWILVANSSEKTLNHFNLLPHSHLILCDSDDKMAFAEFGNVLHLETFPALTNSGMSLKLKSNENNLISSVNYSDAWIHSDLKRDGGWAIEKIDVNNFCGETENWKESENAKGGTPGQTNSIAAQNPDEIHPKFLRLELTDSQTLKLFFSESLNLESVLAKANYTVDHEIGQPAQVLYDESNLKSFSLKFNSYFQLQTIYNLNISNQLTDCAGNNLNQNYSVRFAIPEKAQAHDLVINELLFNPYSDASDFVELYNRSEKVIDLKPLFFTSRDDDGNLKTRTEISNSYLIFPKEYFVITPDAESVIQSYFIENENAFAENALPSLADDAGNIVLMNQELEIIDEFAYSDDMHYALLTTTEGISLERIDFNNLSSNANNWHSASELVGWATPTYKNSAYNETPVSDQTISVEPEVFSPDNDGYDDWVYISYKLEKEGYMANVLIYDANGQLINRIANNELLGIEGHFKWNGTYNDKEIAKMGIYIIYIELFDLEGKVKKYKKTCVLAKQF